MKPTRHQYFYPKKMNILGLDTEFDPKLELSKYKFPTLDLLEEHGSGQIEIKKEVQHKNQNLLSHYNIGIEKIKATVGPTVTLMKLCPEKESDFKIKI